MIMRELGEIHNIIFDIFEKKNVLCYGFTYYLHNNVNK